MSDLNGVQDPATELLRERVRQIEADIAAHKARMEGATMVRDELLDLIATLSRKPRARKPRIVTEQPERDPAPPLNSPALPFTFAPAFVPDGAA